jgi:tRNA (Thr-GGU) A37 N-methylase
MDKAQKTPTVVFHSKAHYFNVYQAKALTAQEVRRTSLARPWRPEHPRVVGVFAQRALYGA